MPLITAQPSAMQHLSHGSSKLSMVLKKRGGFATHTHPSLDEQQSQGMFKQIYAAPSRTEEATLHRLMTQAANKGLSTALMGHRRKKTRAFSLMDQQHQELNHKQTESCASYNNKRRDFPPSHCKMTLMLMGEREKSCTCPALSCFHCIHPYLGDKQKHKACNNYISDLLTTGHLLTHALLKLQIDVLTTK